MDVDQESSLNHKNKKFCINVAFDDKNEYTNSENYSDGKSVDQGCEHASETLVSNTEVLGEDQYLDPNIQSLVCRKGASHSETAPPVSMCIDKRSGVTIIVKKASDLSVEVSSKDSSGGSCISGPVDPSAVADINDKIDYGQASLYWKAIPATVDGMLGGFAHISSTDINGSSSLIKWIYNQKEKPGHGRCVDCGAGIGRITQRLLQKHFGKVDLVEQSPDFVEKAKEIFAKNSKIGEIYCVGLQDFTPSPGIYDVVWTQWVLGYLRDDDLIAFFRRMSESLKPNGVIVVKENFTTDCDGISAETVLDAEDSSVTRPLALLLKLASSAGLNVLRVVQQRRFPKQLYKVYMIVFRPEEYSTKAPPVAADVIFN